jgi:hypothetical protein
MGLGSAVAAKRERHPEWQYQFWSAARRLCAIGLPLCCGTRALVRVYRYRPGHTGGQHKGQTVQRP